MRRSSRSLFALVAGLALLATACSGGGDNRPSLADEKTPLTAAVGSTGTTVPEGDYIVRAGVANLAVYETPGAASPSHEFENPWYYETDVDRRYPQTAVFYSEQQRNGWVRVLLPVRPNGTTGWVKTSDVQLVPSRFRIDVDLSDHRLTVHDGDRVILEDTVAVGARETPTPIGKFYLRIVVKVPDPDTVYGPYAYGLSSHSDVLPEFNGGEAEVGIHGNNDASVLGKDVSHGCIRMDNDKITQLVRMLPMGTPVEVQA
jgi:lipoprotein-anchoring transpeptidase ErfK/SrfK